MKPRFGFPPILLAGLVLLGSSGRAASQESARNAPYPPQAVPGEFIVGLEPESSARIFAKSATLEEDLAVAGLQLVETLPEIDAVVVRDALQAPQIKSAAAVKVHAAVLGRVRYVEPNYLVHAMRTPDDPRFSEQWAFVRIGAKQAWDRTTGSARVVVAVVDTGIDLVHQDLKAQLWRNAGEVPGNNADDDGNGIVDDVHGARFIGGASGDPADDEGHGTHVAGTVAAASDNALGVAGTSWQAQLMAVKFLNSSGSGTSADGARSIVYAVRNGARIVQCSWGGYGYSQAIFDAISYALREGRLLVASAGNDLNDNDSRPAYPASYPHPNILAVQSTTSNDALSWFSNFGAASVDVGAPGSSILSTYPGDRYDTMSGTSMASPHASGAAVLVIALADAWTTPDVRRYLLDSAQPVPALAGRSVTGARLSIARATAAPARFRVPAAGTNWRPGALERLDWDETFRSSACPSGDLALSIDDGATWSNPLATGVAFSALAHDIAVPSTASTRARLRLVCTGTSIASLSEAFSIVTPLRVRKPAANAVWRGGKHVTIEWDGAVNAGGDPTCSAVSIALSKDRGATFARFVAHATPNDGSHRLRAPFLNTRDAVIKISCDATPDSAISDSFRIRNPLPVLLLLVVLVAIGL